LEKNNIDWKYLFETLLQYEIREFGNSKNFVNFIEDFITDYCDYNEKDIIREVAMKELYLFLKAVDKGV
jgi:hypothetical protein